MLLVICAVLAIGSLLYVFWVKPEVAPAVSPRERELAFLNERKEVIYENLRDLHLEYRMGKLSESDYERLKEHYREQLAALLHALEQVRGPEPPPPQPRPGTCPRCGHENASQHRFCGVCGTPLPTLTDSSV